jgi:hypothetical protein
MAPPLMAVVLMGSTLSDASKIRSPAPGFRGMDDTGCSSRW